MLEALVCSSHYEAPLRALEAKARAIVASSHSVDMTDKHTVGWSNQAGSAWSRSRPDSALLLSCVVETA